MVDALLLLLFDAVGVAIGYILVVLYTSICSVSFYAIYLSLDHDCVCDDVIIFSIVPVGLVVSGLFSCRKDKKISTAVVTPVNDLSA